MANLVEIVDALKASGEVTRLRLLALLVEGELTVKDMTDILKQSQPRISRHLRLLTDAGLVERHAEGAWAYFRLSDQGDGADIVRFVISHLTDGDPQVRRDREALRTLRTAQQRQAKDYFSGVAESWDAVRSMHVPEDAVEKAILDASKGQKIDLLLDLGTGTGRMLELLKDRYRRGIGIDSSREMLAVARAKLNEAGIGHAQVRHGDLNNFELNTDKADLIILHQVLHYFDDPSLALERARNALSASGQILIVDLAPHTAVDLREKHAHRRLGLSGEQMEQWARQSGLVVQKQMELGPQESSGRTDLLSVCVWTLAHAAQVETQNGTQLES